MATSKDIIKQALRNIGVLESGEEPSSEELNDSYEIATQMTEDWSNENLLIYGATHESFTIDTVGAANNYTIGSGATLNTARPLRILNIRDRDSSGHETDIKLVGMNQWASINNRNSVARPNYAYYNPTYPNGTLYLDSIPEAGHFLKLVSYKEFTALPALNTAVDYPPGYERCIRLNLEIELAIAFERQVNPVTARLANAAKKKIKRTNSRPLNMKVDAGLHSRRSSYDINSGPA